MQQKKLKVLFLPSWYPNKNDTMAGLFVKNHALAVLPFVDVSVLHIIYNTTPQNKAIEFEYTVDDAIPTLIGYIRQNGSFLDRVLYPFRYIKAAFKGYKIITKKTGKADLHHVHILTRSGLVALYQKITKGIPYIITEHWSRYLPQNSGSYKGIFRKWLTKKVAENASLITTVSKHLGNAMQKHQLNNSYKQISNVVDIERFKPAIAKANNKKPALLHVSCFDEKPKNVRGILNAAKILEDEGFGFELRLVGDGIDHQDCMDCAKQLNLKNVQFLGLKTADELIKEYQNADTFILFSRFENQPVVILEALACGLPVIATKVGGIPEIITPEFGELITSENEAELVAAIKKVISFPKNYNSEAMRQYALDNFSYEGVGKQLHNFYLSILQQYN